MKAKTASAESVIDYTRRLAGLLGLAHWRIDFDPTPDDDDALASMRVISGQQRAVLQIGKKYHTQSPEDQRSTILHELIHIYLWPCGEVIEHVQPHLGTVAAAVVQAEHELAIERATDALSIAIAPHFPLPSGK